MSIDNYTDRERELHNECSRLTAERDALARCKLADQDAYVAMRDQRDAARADALRYRWLRTYKPVSLLKLAPTQEPYLNAVDVVDAAIDKAMVEQCAYMDFSDSKFMSEEIDELRAALADRDAKLAALEGAYIPTYLERLAASPATLEAEFTALRSEALDLRAALAERDAKLAALEKQEPVGVVAQDDDGIFVDFHHWPIDGLQIGSDVYAAAGAAPFDPDVSYQEHLDSTVGIDPAGAAPVPEGWRSAVAMAYGHLWHVNNEPMAPIPLRSEESASYAARKLLRDLLTTEERGEAINAVQKLLAAAPKEPT